MPSSSTVGTPKGLASQHVADAPLQPVDAGQRYTVDEGSRYLRVSRAQLYLDISAGHLRTIKHGRRRYIPGSEIIRLSTLPPMRPQ